MQSFVFRYPLIFIFLLTIMAFSFSSCSFRPINRFKNIDYTTKQNRFSPQQLNVFAPAKKVENAPVLIFIHGGNWNSGKKETYSFFGNRWARKGVTTVVIDYPKSPYANFEDMAATCAEAIIWAKNNIAKYGGDPGNIFISGHSAGGHLAGLLSVDDHYFTSQGTASPIKGAVLLDAAGFDMYAYLTKQNYPEDHTYLNTFTNNPEMWKKGSILYQVDKTMPPMILYCGEKTYPDMITGTEMFVKQVAPYGVETTYTLLKGKTHVEVISQFFFGWNPRYKEIKSFMQRHIEEKY